jgi:hypothetical protein
MERYDDPEPYCVLGVEFSAVELRGSRARFFAELQDVAKAQGLERMLFFTRDHSARSSDGRIGSWPHSTEMWRIFTPDLPGVGTFFVRGERFELPAGLEMVWRTAAIEARQPPKPVRDIPRAPTTCSVRGSVFR